MPHDGSRADTLAVLRGWEPRDATQDALRARFVTHLEQHADGMHRRCRPDHITASTLVVSPDATHVLLTLHAKARVWFQLGGHVEDADPTLVAAARREVLEESGLDLDIDPSPVHLDEHAVPFCGDDGSAHHLDVRFVAVARDPGGHHVSDESLDVRWWPVDDLPTPDLDGLVRAARVRVLGTGSPVDAAHPM